MVATLAKPANKDIFNHCDNDVMQIEGNFIFHGGFNIPTWYNIIVSNLSSI